MHQMAVRADPNRGGAPAQVFWKIFGLNYGAIDNMPRHAHLITHQSVAHG